MSFYINLVCPACLSTKMVSIFHIVHTSFLAYKMEKKRKYQFVLLGTQETIETEFEGKWNCACL